MKAGLREGQVKGPKFLMDGMKKAMEQLEISSGDCSDCLVDHAHGHDRALRSTASRNRPADVLPI